MHSSSFSTVAFLATLARALNTIEVQSQNFVDSKTGGRFEILGVDYQPGGESGFQPGKLDPLSNRDNCLRDAALMQMLGVNTIRSYNLDYTLNHDACASIFNAVGIYMIIDVNAPLDGASIDRSKPRQTYDTEYLNRTFNIIDAFRGYPNTLGFFGANELINDVPTAKGNPPYIRAVQRDMKNYMKARGGRQIPVGYSAADVKELRHDQANYLQCYIDGDKNDMSRSDFFGINSYSWCGDSSFQSAGYDQLVDVFGNLTMPIFFSEYGCNNVQPRTFQEVGTLYGPQMTTFSGGLVYEYSQEQNNYGLVQINPDGSAKVRGDYDALQKQYNSLDLNLIFSHNDTASTLQPPDCSSDLLTNPNFDTSFDLPETPDGAQRLIKNGAGGQMGKIINVGNTKVQAPVQGSNGQPIQNLAIKPMQSANAPGGGTTTGSGSSSSSSGAAVPHLAASESSFWSLGAMVLAFFAL